MPEPSTSTAGADASAILWRAAGGVVAVLVAVFIPITAPVMGLLLVAAGLGARRQPATRSVGTVLLVAGVILLLLSLVVAVFGLSVSGGGS